MVKFENVTKCYAKSSVKAVDDLTMELRDGEIFGFLGPNGAGKTTTIKMMTGILPFEIGRITVCGHDIVTDALAAKREIGYVTDSGVLYEKLTGREFVDFMADIYGVGLKERRERADKLLTAFNLTAAFDSQINTYSHGMKQKIAIIGALVHSPKVLVLDEPMVGLDPQSMREFKDIMRAHAAAGNTVFFSTHVLDVAERICDRVGIIAKGRLLAGGTMEEIKAAKGGDETLEDFFLSVAGTEA